MDKVAGDPVQILPIRATITLIFIIRIPVKRYLMMYLLYSCIATM
jgi:hypothetical protein